MDSRQTESNEFDYCYCGVDVMTIQSIKGRMTLLDFGHYRSGFLTLPDVKDSSKGKESLILAHFDQYKVGIDEIQSIKVGYDYLNACEVYAEYEYTPNFPLLCQYFDEKEHAIKYRYYNAIYKNYPAYQEFLLEYFETI